MKKTTLTIGIPAYNEEGNILQLLKSILSQKQKSFRIEKVLVISDGSTDRTNELVNQMHKKYPLITLMTSKKRGGKARALNLMFKLNASDLHLTVDADLVFTNDLSIEHMVSELRHNPFVQLVGPRHISVYPKTLMGRFAYYSFVSFEDAFLQIRKGNNFYGMMGSGLMRKEFAKTVRYPEGTISDQCYLYAFATRKNKDGFHLVKKAGVYFMPVTTFTDWRILGVRSVSGDKEDVAKHFGKKILEEFSMPKGLYMKSLVKWLFKSPFYMTGSILMNMYIRQFPYKKFAPKNGMWTLARSSKIGIFA